MTTEGWMKTDHACRFCGGRVLASGEIYECSTCDARTAGNPVGICGCGVHLGPVPRNARQVQQQRHRLPQAFRCAGNPDPRPLSPARVVIMYGDTPVGDLLLRPVSAAA